MHTEHHNPGMIPMLAGAMGTPLTMSSREIAELCEKRHDHVLRDIEKMLQDIGDPKFGASSFEAEYTTPQNKQAKEYRPTAGLIHTQVTGPMVDNAVAAPSKQERMQSLADELLAMVREEFPEGVRIGVRIADSGGLSAFGLAREWQPDERLRNGGMWIERDAGYLALDEGKMIRQISV